EYMAQPFLEQICTEGEYSLFLFGGELSHAVRKVPKAMDFRVQEEHGARILAVTPEADLVEACERVMTALGSAPLYARVDLVRGEASPLLMELELIEPSLYFDFDPDSPQRFAEAFAAHMDNPATTAT
ncbi:MAG: hypothetical protein R3200_13885, partial [Xanthomonadales bacterium]|nr:hypothetical protein [Xanthomonadales bacterium]